MMPFLFDVPPHQLELPLPPPFDPGDLVGRESKGVYILAQPRFSWLTGKWMALSNVSGMLALCEFTITKREV